MRPKNPLTTVRAHSRRQKFRDTPEIVSREWLRLDFEYFVLFRQGEERGRWETAEHCNERTYGEGKFSALSVGSSR
jgi:hypothetical protein